MASKLIEGQAGYPNPNARDRLTRITLTDGTTHASPISNLVASDYADVGGLDELVLHLTIAQAFTFVVEYTVVADAWPTFTSTLYFGAGTHAIGGDLIPDWAGFVRVRPTVIGVAGAVALIVGRS